MTISTIIVHHCHYHHQKDTMMMILMMMVNHYHHRRPDASSSDPKSEEIHQRGPTLPFALLQVMCNAVARLGEHSFHVCVSRPGREVRGFHKGRIWLEEHWRHDMGEVSCDKLLGKHLA
jgi:hypothetical protein